MKDTIFVEDNKIFRFGSKCNIQFDAGHGSRSCAIYNKPDFVNSFLLKFQGIDECSTADYSSPMLIVMHHRNFQSCAELSFNIKTFRRFNILQVDAAKSRFKRFYYLYEFLRICFVYFNIKYVDVSKYFKQNALPFHHRFGSL